jgi:hypothetical protein
MLLVKLSLIAVKLSHTWKKFLSGIIFTRFIKLHMYTYGYVNQYQSVCAVFLYMLC